MLTLTKKNEALSSGYTKNNEKEEDKEKEEK
jgi:hypothetical protein